MHLRAAMTAGNTAAKEKVLSWQFLNCLKVRRPCLDLSRSSLHFLAIGVVCYLECSRPE